MCASVLFFSHNISELHVAGIVWILCEIIMYEKDPMAYFVANQME